MNVSPNNPIIVQSDKTLLVEVNNELYTEVRDKLSRFAEVIKSPEYIHTYKISPLSLWNAASSGMGFEDIIEILEKYSKYDIPQNVIKDIEDNINKYGKIKILRDGKDLIIKSEDNYIMKEITNYKVMEKYFKERIDDVFSLIGPKKYDVPWKVLEKQGWIAEAQCTEIRVEIPEELKMEYAVSDSKNKFRIASENHKKIIIFSRTRI